MPSASMRPKPWLGRFELPGPRAELNVNGFAPHVLVAALVLT